MKKKLAITLWRKKASVLACVVVATVFGSSSALAANGGNFILAANNTATLATYMTAAVPGTASLIINNPSTAASSTALDLRVSSRKAPLKVNSDAKVTNLNADKLDGKNSTDFLSAGRFGAAPSTYGTGSDTTDTGQVEPCMLGEIRLFGGTFAPSDWDWADGEVLSISQYTALYSILGN